MIGNIIAGIFPTDVAAGDFESIATISVGSGGVANIEFTSIPSTYQHLQIRGIVKTARAVITDFLICQFNSDTGANYKGHVLAGDGANAYAEAPSSIELGTCAGNTNANIFSVHVIDLLDYKDTNKYTTLRALNGLDQNGSGNVSLVSGQWRNTAAITSVKIYSGTTNNINQYSHFALYGIKG